MNVAFFCVAFLWFSLGTWLTVDSIEVTVARARKEHGYILWPVLFFAFLVTVVFAPALFIRALFKGRGNV
jgi:hypothetical protein